ncbi:unnamed protein product, partial [Amoebophrya sp. A120]
PPWQVCRCWSTGRGKLPTAADPPWLVCYCWPAVFVADLAPPLVRHGTSAAAAGPPWKVCQGCWPAGATFDFLL